MPRRFPHHLKIVRLVGGTPGPGVQDPDGNWTPTDPAGDQVVTLYDDAADVQDGGATVRRDAVTGVPVETADAWAFLRAANRVALIRRGDTAQITWEDGTEDEAEVVSVVRLDARIALAFI